jgi:hypothetical protein
MIDDDDTRRDYEPGHASAAAAAVLVALGIGLCALLTAGIFMVQL